MKICIFPDAWLPIWGGGQTHILETSRLLASRYNCQVDIYSPRIKNSSGKTEPVKQSYERGKLRIIPIGPTFIFPNFIGRIAYTLACLKVVLATPYDIYHVHTLTMLPLLIIAKILHPSSITAFTLHGLGKELLGAGLVNKVLPLTSLSELLLYHLPINLRFTAAKSSINSFKGKPFIFLGNGVYRSFLKITRKSLSNHDLLFVGRLEPVKGINVLLQAVESLLSKDPALTLTIVGHGPLEHVVEDYIKSHNLGKIVEIKHILGEKVISEYQKAGLFVLPSISEGFPLVVLEAMATGLPVVATRVGDIPDIIEEGSTGFLVQPNNVEALAETIQKALNADRLKMGNMAREKIRQAYSWDTIAARIYDNYSKVLPN